MCECMECLTLCLHPTFTPPHTLVPQRGTCLCTVPKQGQPSGIILFERFTLNFTLQQALQKATIFVDVPHVSTSYKVLHN